MTEHQGTTPPWPIPKPKQELHMKEPIWVWCYDFSITSHPHWKGDPAWDREGAPLVYPQAHTYAFRSEEEARHHPEAMGWKKDHKYILQKVYLN